MCSWFVPLDFMVCPQFSYYSSVFLDWPCLLSLAFWILVISSSAYHHSFVLLPSCFFGCCIRVPFCDNMTPLLSSNSVHFHGVVPRLRSVPMPWKHKKNPWEIDVVRLIVLISISGNPISGKMLMSTVRWFFVGLEGSLSGPTAFNSSKLS